METVRRRPLESSNQCGSFIPTSWGVALRRGQDDHQALAWTLRAAESGLANAQFSAGTMCFSKSNVQPRICHLV